MTPRERAAEIAKEIICMSIQVQALKVSDSDKSFGDVIVREYEKVYKMAFQKIMGD